MKGIVYLFIILAAFLFLVITLLLPFKLNTILKQRFNWKFRIISIVPLITILILAYFSFYPRDSYYVKIYKQVTKNELPKNSSFISKYSSDPTFIEGWTLMMIKLVTIEYEKLEVQLKAQHYKIKMPTNYDDLRNQFNVKDFFKLRSNLRINYIFFIEPKPYIYYGVAFMNDGQTIIVKKIV